jgi:prophage regulatory protein
LVPRSRRRRVRDGQLAATVLIVANDEARALLARGKKSSRAFKQAAERWAGGRIDWAARVDVVAVRASIRKARVEDEVEKRVTARAEPDRFLRVPDVVKLTGLHRSSLWRLERAGDFPKRVRLTSNTVAWRASEVAAWIARRGR